MVCQQPVFFHTAKYLFVTLSSVCVGRLLFKFPTKITRMFFFPEMSILMKSTGWHWSFVDPFPTGVVSAPLFVSWWVGLCYNTQKGKEGLQ